MDETTLENLGYVKASKYRITILLSLKGGILCPKEISDNTKYPQSHVSGTLSELAKYNLVECINPKYRKGRLYQLTPQGKLLLEYL